MFRNPFQEFRSGAVPFRGRRRADAGPQAGKRLYEGIRAERFCSSVAVRVRGGSRGCDAVMLRSGRGLPVPQRSGGRLFFSGPVAPVGGLKRCAVNLAVPADGWKRCVAVALPSGNFRLRAGDNVLSFIVFLHRGCRGLRHRAASREQEGIIHKSTVMSRERLITPGYCFIIAANFLLYFGFYLLMPVFPFYLTEVFGTGSATMGIALSCYTLAALTIRPFSGYLLDTFARKPLYIFAYFIFTSIFAGYIVAGTLAVFIILRVVHGLAFGTVTVSGNTLVIDITPSSRRGEALGYYGLANNIAMSIGPMVGLFMHDAGLSFNVLFVASLGSCSLGLLFALLVRTPVKPQVRREPISLDRFFLVKGIPAGLDLLLLSIPYGMTTSYVAMYARQIGIVSGSGLFFTLMAVGMAVSRMFSGRQVDRGRIVAVISFGIYLVCFCFFGLSACNWLMAEAPAVGRCVFFGIALLLGVGFGTMFPAFNTLFVNLAPNSKRGTATSTYLTSWDVGIGAGLLLGGYVGQISTLDTAYFVGACLTVVSAVFFHFKVGPHFERNKLR